MGKDSQIQLLTRQLELQNTMLKQQAERITEQENTIKDLREIINELKSVKAGLEETLDEFRRKLFGISSERTSNASKKTSREAISDDAEDEKDEVNAKPSANSLPKLTVSSHTRTRKPKACRDELYKDLPIREVYIPATGSACTCPYCNSKMQHYMYKFGREELRIIPAKVERIHLMKEVVQCPKCIEDGDVVFDEARLPKGLLPHSPVSASLAAEVMYRKSAEYLPFYRMEADTAQTGAMIPRETSSSWFIKCAEKYLAPLWNELHAEQLTRGVLCADETTAQVLREKDKTAESCSYMWVYSTANDGLPPVVVYEYQPTRAGNNAKNYLHGFHGLLQCDGFAGYHKVEDVTLVICVAHLRRKFFEAIPTDNRKGMKLLDINSEEALKEPEIPDESQITLSPGEIGVAYCNKLFYLERCFKEMTAEERTAERQKFAVPVWENFWKWIDSLHPLGASKLEKAVNYALNHKGMFENYMLDGRCDISNNRAERKCKNYALMRKNSLFHTSEAGAMASAVVGSLVETARANNLNVYQYLYMVLLYMPDYKDKPAGIKALLPWSPFMKEHCSGLRDTENITLEKHPDLPI